MMEPYTVHVERLYTVMAESPSDAIRIYKESGARIESESTDMYVTDEYGEEYAGSES